jgi:hypothetical protein
MSMWKQVLLTLGGLALLAYLGGLGWLFLRQEKLLFQPEVLAADQQFALGDDVHELQIAVPGASLSALHLQLPAPRGVVFFLHGNGGNLANWFVNVDFYRRANFDLFMIDYRGYGKSSGRIESEAQLRADVRTAYAQMAPRYAGLKVVIYGRSLGTGLAAGLAADVQPTLTMLVSPYISMQALMADYYPLVPGALLRYPLRTDLDLPRIKSTVLLIHGDHDPLILPAHSAALLPLAQHDQLVLIPGAAHNDLQDFEAYREAVREALDGA